MKIKNNLKLNAVALVCILGCTIAQADESKNSSYNKSLTEQKPTLNTIIVTADRREKSLLSFPGSLTTVSSQELNAVGADNLQDLSYLVPGMTISQPLKNRSTINIRSLNTDIGTSQLTQEPTSLYFNSAPAFGPYAELFVPDLNLFDIDRIEVLKGSQGTLFGAGSLAGVVRIITKSPELDAVKGAVRLDYGSTDGAGNRTRTDVMLNVPLIEDELAIRLVGSYRDDDGWIENIVTGSSNSIEETTLRASALWVPNDRWEFDAEILYIDSDPEAGDDFNPSLGDFQQDRFVDEGRPGEFTLSTLDVSYEIEGVGKLVSASSFSSVETTWVNDFGPFGQIGRLINDSEPFETDTFTQELRLVSNDSDTFEWVVGAFYSDYEVDSRFEFQARGLSDFFSAIVGPGVVTSDVLQAADVVTTYEERALFGDLTWHLNDQWSLTTGVRFVDTEATYRELGGTQFNFATLSNIASPLIDNVSDDSDTLGRLVLSYAPSENANYYASISRGFRAGQSNPTNGPSLVDPSDVVIEQGYQSDTTVNFEIGARLSLFDQRVFVDSTLYHIDWSDIQVDAIRRSDNRNYIANAGDATVTGLELSIDAKLSEKWQWTISGSVQDSEIDDISAQDSFLSGAVSGDPLPGTGDYSLSSRLSYETPIFTDKKLNATLFVSVVDESFNNFSNFTGSVTPNINRAINDDYTNLGARLTLASENWDLVAYVENLTNNDDVILNLAQQVPSNSISLRPRTIGARLSYSF